MRSFIASHSCICPRRAEGPGAWTQSCEEDLRAQRLAKKLCGANGICRIPDSPLVALVKGDETMKVMVLVKATKESEAGTPPDEKLISQMMAFNEQLVKAGVMLAGEG